jgi:hypothetical protein
MKKILSKPSCHMFLLLLILFSCTSEPLFDKTSNPQEELLSIRKRLTFDTIEDFLTALTRFSDTEDYNYSYCKDIKAWETSLSFESMRSKFEALIKEFEGVSSPEEMEEFIETHRSWVYYSERAYQLKPIMNLALMNILAFDGTVEIADALYKYTPNRIIIVLDKDESKMEKALITGTANEDEGVFIVENWRFETSPELRSCDGTKSLSCTAPEINSKRVIGNWEVFLSASPVRNVHGQVLGWDIGYAWDILIRGQKRGIFNNWVSNSTRLGFVSGFGIFSSLFGTTNTGTGWVSGSNVSQINHTFMVQGPSYFPGHQWPSGHGNYYITYCTCGAKDANVFNLYCYDCCPWDCSDLDWNFIQ